MDTRNGKCSKCPPRAREGGATLLEYGLLLALISALVLLAVYFFGVRNAGVFTVAGETMQGNSTGLEEGGGTEMTDR